MENGKKCRHSGLKCLNFAKCSFCKRDNEDCTDKFDEELRVYCFECNATDCSCNPHFENIKFPNK